MFREVKYCFALTFSCIRWRSVAVVVVVVVVVVLVVVVVVESMAMAVANLSTVICLA